MKKIFIFAILLYANSQTVEAQTIEIKFIGNAGFWISDSSTTLLSDFPYHSGAFGYMEYDFESVNPEGDVLSLITHGHADHFEASLFESTNWTLLAPEDVKVSIPKERQLVLKDEVVFKDIRIRPIATDHADVGHYSYLVEWHGFRFYFTGDTESTEELENQSELDVLFITPWLLQKMKQSKHVLQAKRVLVYHHMGGEKIECNPCLVLQQGEGIELEFCDCL